VGNFFTDVLRQHPRFTSTAPVGDLELLEPETRRRVQALIADAAAAGVTLMPFETYRSKERQQLLFTQKVTKLQNVGVHHYGLACDIVRSVGGKPSWKGDFSIIGRLARKHGLIWGGDWGRPGVKPNFVDPVHVQRCPVARQRELFAGSWYPDDAYDPWGELGTAAPRARQTRGAREEGSNHAAEHAAEHAAALEAELAVERRAARATKAKAETERSARRPAKRTTKRPATRGENRGEKGGLSKRSSAKPSGKDRAVTERTAKNRAAAAKRRAAKGQPRVKAADRPATRRTAKKGARRGKGGAR